MRLGTQDLGTGARTLAAVITADAPGLRPSQVRPEIGGTLYGVSALSGGSTAAASISPGIRLAAIRRTFTALPLPDTTSKAESC
jgi:xanthine dehydrogenase YagR molybdenum-binding subunit